MRTLTNTSQKEETMKKNNAHNTRILFPTDFTEVSMNAFEYALNIAEAVDAELLMLNVHYETPAKNDLIPAEITDKLRKDHVAESEIRFSGFLDLASQRFGKDVPLSRYVRFGATVEEIISLSEESQASMIIMGTMGAESLAECVMGSVTSKVIAQANCPVLAIPSEARFRPIRHVMYAMSMEEGDFDMVDRLLDLTQQMDARLYCTHIRTENNYWDRIELSLFEKMFQLEAEDHLIEFYIANHPDVLLGLSHFVNHHSVDMIAMHTHKRFMLDQVYSESLTRKMALHTDIPLLSLPG